MFIKKAVLVASLFCTTSAFAFSPMNDGSISVMSEDFLQGNGSMVSMSCLDGKAVPEFKLLSNKTFLVKGEEYVVEFYTKESNRYRQTFKATSESALKKETDSLMHMLDFDDDYLHAIIPTYGNQQYRLDEDSQKNMDSFLLNCVRMHEEQKEEKKEGSGNSSGCFINTIGGL